MAGDFARAQAAKAAGNAHYAQGRHDAAREAYAGALALLARATEGDAARALRAACLCNRAAAALALQAWADAAADCAACLDELRACAAPTDELRVLRRKALFRRARASEALDEPDAAADGYAASVLRCERGSEQGGEALGALHRVLTAAGGAPAPSDEEVLGRSVDALLALAAGAVPEDEADADAEGGGAGGEGGGERAAPAAAPALPPEHKRLVYAALLSVLRERTHKRTPAFKAFLRRDGARLVHTCVHSMEGDWMADAKRGTLRDADALARLPGVRAAMAALELNAVGLHTSDEASAGAHGPGCTH